MQQRSEHRSRRPLRRAFGSLVFLRVRVVVLGPQGLPDFFLENEQCGRLGKRLVLTTELALEVLDALRAGDGRADLRRSAKTCQRLLPPLFEQRRRDALVAKQYSDLTLRQPCGFENDGELLFWLPVLHLPWLGWLVVVRLRHPPEPRGFFEQPR